MHVNINQRSINLLKACRGFTLIEALIAVALLAIVAVGISAPFISGFQALDVQAERMLLDSRLRSRMEVLAGTDFGSLNAGSEAITIRGRNYTIAWTVANVDLDGDLTPEPTAKQVTVSVSELPGHALTTIRVDNEGRVGKIS